VTVFVVFLLLAIYNAGCMTTLQLQHYGIYPAVGQEHFAAYVRANNRAATWPTIVPAMLLLLSSLLLVVQRPGFVAPSEAAAGLALNLVALLSTFVWQRPLHGRLAQIGYDEPTVRRLIATNWIRTIDHWLIALLATTMLLRLIAV
jgi:hypothetical protein